MRNRIVEATLRRPRRLSERMRICLLTRALPVHSKGGLEYHSYDLAHGVASRGHEVTVLSSAHPQGKELEREGNLKIHFLPGSTPGKYSLAFFRLLSSRLEQLHASERFDVVHSQGLAGMFLPRRFLRSLGERHVVTIHGTLFSETPLYREHFRQYSLPRKVAKLWQYKHRILVYPFYGRLLRRSSRVIVDSEFTRGELKLFREDVQSRLRLVRLGVSEARYPYILKDEARKRLNLNGTILFTLGRLEEMKGIRVALEGLRALPERHFRYLIAGTGSRRRELEQFCSKNGLWNVSFLGEVSAEEVPWYFAAADLFIYPELGQPAFGLVAIEAMLQGTPVLASRAGAIPEVVTSPVGFLFERGNPISLAEELQRLLESPDLLQAAASRCRDYVLRSFSYDSMIERTIGVYREIERA
jgi:glycosyltransferase involved in cell wall biosynthesis